MAMVPCGHTRHAQRLAGCFRWGLAQTRCAVTAKHFHNSWKASFGSMVARRSICWGAYCDELSKLLSSAHVHCSVWPNDAMAQWHDMMVSLDSICAQAGTASWHKAHIPTVEYTRNPAFAKDTTAQLCAHCAELKAGQCRDAAQIATAYCRL